MAFSSFQLLVLGLAQAESLQRLERRRGGLLQRRGKFLHRADRLAQLLPQIGGGLVERLQHLLLAFGFGLLVARESPVCAFTAFRSIT